MKIFFFLLWLLSQHMSPGFSLRLVIEIGRGRRRFSTSATLPTTNQVFRNVSGDVVNPTFLEQTATNRDLP